MIKSRAGNIVGLQPEMMDSVRTLIDASRHISAEFLTSYLLDRYIDIFEKCI